MEQGMPAKASDRTLAALVGTIRRERGWTLKQMSEAVGIPLSTLGKVEAGKLSLSYDKLQQLASGLGISMADFFSQTADELVEHAPVTARRSLTSSGQSVTIETQNYIYEYLCADLTRKQMVPIIVEIKAETPEDFGQAVSHPGEEFIFVLEGEIQVNLEFYRPTTLKAGEGIYVDSSMKHSYTLGNCKRAKLLAVCSGDEEALQSSAAAMADPD
jgi:transcriptional regulator with XRE-family HTH domain